MTERFVTSLVSVVVARGAAEFRLIGDGVAGDLVARDMVVLEKHVVHPASQHRRQP
ncbi:MAG: hypothetical protein P8N02_05390 [Actinomycetota bacterium]|nr:hypothetical protein [Actinomycetota bacterium]